MKKAIVVFVFCAVLAALADNPHVTSLAQLVDVALTTPANGDTLTFDGPSGKWVNKPASAASNGPQIVARFDQEGITGDTNTPLFTAPETATYRVTFYGNTTAIDTTLPLPFFVQVSVFSTLSNGGLALGINHQGLTINQLDSSLLRVNAGESPTLSVTNTTNVTYGLHIVSRSYNGSVPQGIAVGHMLEESRSAAAGVSLLKAADRARMFVWNAGDRA